jgi:hypothetical protein
VDTADRKRIASQKQNMVFPRSLEPGFPQIEVMAYSLASTEALFSYGKLCRVHDLQYENEGGRRALAIRFVDPLGNAREQKRLTIVSGYQG